MLRLNLRKINQLIRAAWEREQQAALRSAGKSACYSESLRVASDFFPDIHPLDAERIARGHARLHWDPAQREIGIVTTSPADVTAEESS